MKAYYIHQEQQQGPLECDEIWRMVDQGTLPRSITVCLDGKCEWLPFAQLPDTVFSEEIINLARTRNAAKIQEQNQAGKGCMVLLVYIFLGAPGVISVLMALFGWTETEYVKDGYITRGSLIAAIEKKPEFEWSYKPVEKDVDAGARFGAFITGLFFLTASVAITRKIKGKPVFSLKEDLA